VSSAPYLRDLLDLGPQGVLAHAVGPQEVRAALVRASKGENCYEGPSLESSIQDCERAVLRYLAFGLTNPEIAQKLQVSERTVKNRVSALLEKLPVRNRVELALYYLGMHPNLWAGEKVTL
jgi:DNA-binding NarL/FixJ family response regulator